MCDVRKSKEVVGVKFEFLCEKENGSTRTEESVQKFGRNHSTSSFLVGNVFNAQEENRCSGPTTS